MTWTRNGGGTASSTAKPVTFGLGAETNKTIHVQDNKTTGTFVDLGTATWNDAGTPTSFEYDLTLAAGGLGTCTAYTNTARIQQTSQQAQQTVNVCVPNVTLSKTVSVARGGTVVGGTGTHVLPGDVLTWTITVNNTSTVAYSGALFTDDLTSTVAGVTLAGAPDFNSSDPSVATSFDAGTSTLSGTATNLAAGASVTVTYSGTVKTRAELTAGGVTTIDNTVVPGDDVPNCTTTPGCDTTNPVTPQPDPGQERRERQHGSGLVAGLDADRHRWRSHTDQRARHHEHHRAERRRGQRDRTTPSLRHRRTPRAPSPTATPPPASGRVSTPTRSRRMTTTTASVTPEDGADVTCTITNTYRPVATATKTVASTVENNDGSWTITYDLVVTNPDSALAGDLQPVRHSGLRHRHDDHRRRCHHAGRNRRPGLGRFGHQHPRHRPPAGSGRHRDVDHRSDGDHRRHRAASRHRLQPTGHTGLRVLQLGDDHHQGGLGGHLRVLLAGLP